MSEKIIAAVPAYNAGENLLELAGQLDAEQFDDVYILDDCSTDDSVTNLRKQYPHFKVISAQQNGGPAVNRNRILQAGHDGIILFIDADMTLQTTGITEVVKAALSDASIGLLGGFILNKSLQPMDWNYGFEMNPRKDAWFSQIKETINHPDLPEEYRDELADKLRAENVDYNWVNPDLFSLQEREVDWVSEALFAVRADTFSEVNGYDKNMRYHEGQDLARRIRDRGLRTVFTPELKAVHNDVDVRGERRTSDFYESQFYFYKKHWGMTRQVYEQLYVLPALEG